MSAISVLADTFHFVIIGVGSIINKFLHMNYSIVTYIITSIENLKGTLLENLLPLLNILVCYYQDFKIFLKELITIAYFIVNIISNFLLKFSTGISYVVSFFQEIGFITHHSLKNLLTVLCCCILQLYENAVYLIQLIFKSLLLILESGPNLLIFILKVILFCLYNIYDSFEKSLESFVINLNDLFTKSIEVIFSIPIKAYLGILLFITIFYQHKVIIIYLKSYFLFLCLFLVHVGKQICYCIYICLKPVIKVIINTTYKIKYIFISVEEASGDANELNYFNNTANSVKILFQQCMQKVKSFFNYYLFCNKDHVSEEIEKLQKELAAEREKHLCIICFNNPRTMILYPCRHMCVCEECCPNLRAEVYGCPLCRRDVVNIIHVYT